ncbi:MAG: urease accessory protein UreE, partial [Pseudanabaena sp.]
YLRLSPDPVLEDMVRKMGLQVIEEVQPFQPETGAYHHHHDH